MKPYLEKIQKLTTRHKAENFYVNIVQEIFIKQCNIVPSWFQLYTASRQIMELSRFEILAEEFCYSLIPDESKLPEFHQTGLPAQKKNIKAGIITNFFSYFPQRIQYIEDYFAKIFWSAFCKDIMPRYVFTEKSVTRDNFLQLHRELQIKTLLPPKYLIISIPCHRMSSLHFMTQFQQEFISLINSKALQYGFFPEDLNALTFQKPYAEITIIFIAEDYLPQNIKMCLLPNVWTDPHLPKDLFLKFRLRPIQQRYSIFSHDETLYVGGTIPFASKRMFQEKDWSAAFVSHPWDLFEQQTQLFQHIKKCHVHCSQFEEYQKKLLELIATTPGCRFSYQVAQKVLNHYQDSDVSLL